MPDTQSDLPTDIVDDMAKKYNPDLPPDLIEIIGPVTKGDVQRIQAPFFGPTCLRDAVLFNELQLKAGLGNPLINLAEFARGLTDLYKPDLWVEVQQAGELGNSRLKEYLDAAVGEDESDKFPRATQSSAHSSLEHFLAWEYFENLERERNLVSAFGWVEPSKVEKDLYRFFINAEEA